MIKKILITLSIIMTFNSAQAFNIREPLIYCGVAAAVSYAVLDQSMTMTGVLCGAAAASQPIIEGHYKQKHGREYRETISELQNINNRYKNLTWIRGERLGEPQYIIEERIIPGRQTGTSIRSETKEYKFALPDTAGTAIGE